MKLIPDNIPNLGVDDTGMPYLIDQPINDAVLGTVLCANLFNPIIRELYNAITLSGLTPSTDSTQLYQVIKGITTNITNVQGDIVALQNFKNTIAPEISTFLLGTPATGGVAGRSVSVDPSGNIVFGDANGKPYNLVTSDELSTALQAFKASTVSPDDLAKLIAQYNNDLANAIKNLVASGKGIGGGSADDIAQAVHDGNEEIAATLKTLINQAITVSGGTSASLTQEINDRKAADVSLAQTIRDGNEEITNTLKSMVGDAITVSQSSLAQTIHDGNEEITSTLNSMVGKAVNTAQAAVAAEETARIAGETPVGSPVPWPISTIPSGWLLCNGASFSTTQYTQLAAAYPSGNLPDLRNATIYSTAFNYIVRAA